MSLIWRIVKQCGPWILLNWEGICEVGDPQTPFLLSSTSLLALRLSVGGNWFTLQEDLNGWSWTQKDGGIAMKEHTWRWEKLRKGASSPPTNC